MRLRLKACLAEFPTTPPSFELEQELKLADVIENSTFHLPKPILSGTEESFRRPRGASPWLACAARGLETRTNELTMFYTVQLSYILNGPIL